ncbi:VOC family protein [Mycobacterium ostraviense]|uniref:Dioxygenase n=1 Tax=Mycobacterium ostraviense TaxID=2738409 RepID=A0A162D6Y8_9MYCO|nr:VOC family protein [Mycobacterium ostraviense]KZS63454.1 dioxygenase [Mycobacterium ostraviense]UGT91807.1 VOC family protein [Mycobacterium ostraviense]
MRLDHIVLWTNDPRAAMDFYSRVVGLTPVRFDEFEAGEAPFPSVRVSDDSIIDLMPVHTAAATESMTRVVGSAGHPVNHVCLALSKTEYDALDGRLQAAGIDTSARLNLSFGARGWAPQAYYFADPDGNVIEARYYE